MPQPSSPDTAPPLQAGASRAPARLRAPPACGPAFPAPGSCGAGPDRTPCPRRYTAAAGARVVTALTRPGELVVIPDPDTAALITASAASARRVLGRPAGLRQYRDLAAAIRADLDPAARPLARLVPGGAAVLLEASSRHAGRAVLVIIAACPAAGCARPAGPGLDAGVLFAACQRVLRPGGLLAVITSAARAPGQPGELGDRARGRGAGRLAVPAAGCDLPGAAHRGHRRQDP